MPESTGVVGVDTRLTELDNPVCRGGGSIDMKLMMLIGRSVVTSELRAPMTDTRSM